MEVGFVSLRFDALMEENEASQLNPLQLAYVGDSVWELIIRYQLMMKKYNVHHMHQKCIHLVNAHAQAEMLSLIQDELTENEMEVVRRGRNAHPKHASPRHQSPEEYCASTGFEALFGYLYLIGQENRIRILVQSIEKEINNV